MPDCNEFGLLFVRIKSQLHRKDSAYAALLRQITWGKITHPQCQIIIKRFDFDPHRTELQINIPVYLIVP